MTSVVVISVVTTVQGMSKLLVATILERVRSVSDAKMSQATSRKSEDG